MLRSYFLPLQNYCKQQVLYQLNVDLINLILQGLRLNTESFQQIATRVYSVIVDIPKSPFSQIASGKSLWLRVICLVTSIGMLSKLVNSFFECRDIHELTLRNFKTESEKIQLYGDACHIDVRAYYCMMRVKFAKKIEEIRKNKFKEEPKF